MKPAAFDYHAPRSLDEALGLFAELGEGAMALAGGQSLVPLLNMRMATPAALIDLNNIETLGRLEFDGSELRIGAMVRHLMIEDSGLLREHLPFLGEVAAHIAHLQIRTRGTIGGSLAMAAPAAEWPCAVAVLDAIVVTRSATGGGRQLAAHDFFAGPMMTTLASGELVVEIRVPLPAPDSGLAFVEFARRHGDFALAGAAALLRFAQDGRVAEARLAMCGLAEPGVRLTAVEEALIGTGASQTDLQLAERLVRDTVEVSEDIHIGIPSRRRIAGAIARRALETAATRAQRTRNRKDR
jgi:CO/xanthine dehydrogenase FAD-binding subunit